MFYVVIIEESLIVGILFQSTASIPPQMWQPASGIVMTNDIGETSPEETAACIALSKNDSYVMSASGGKVSLFNVRKFKVRLPFT